MLAPIDCAVNAIAKSGKRSGRDTLAEALLQFVKHPDKGHGERTDGRHEEKRQVGNIEDHDHLPGLASRNSQLTNQPT